MNRVITGLLVIFLFLCSSLNADDLSFDSFHAAERAAQQRAQEYERKMKEHLSNVNQKWEQQQRDIGQSGDNPDISNITTSSDGHRSSDNADADKMDKAVESSLNKLKNKMINSASPSSNGFAGGSAGYQWRVKKVGNKYVLSDSYSQATFNTGSKNDSPDVSGDSSAAEPKIVNRIPSSAPATAAPPRSAIQPLYSSPKSSTHTSTPSTTASSSSAPSESSSQKTPPPAPVSELAPPQLPPPTVRLVIEHPIDFSEEIFTSNASKGSAANYQLKRFSIPEDTRVRLSIELADDIDPNNVSMIIVDEEGARPPVTSSKLNNYRHMFRVPSDDEYSASIFINDPTALGPPQRKIMQVQIPVTPVDFKSRTIDGRNTGKSGTTSTSSSMSAPGSNLQARSTFGRPQQVDLSDLYTKPNASRELTSQNSANLHKYSNYNHFQNEDLRDQRTTENKGITHRYHQQTGEPSSPDNQTDQQSQQSKVQRDHPRKSQGHNCDNSDTNSVHDNNQSYRTGLDATSSKNSSRQSSFGQNHSPNQSNSGSNGSELGGRNAIAAGNSTRNPAHTARQQSRRASSAYSAALDTSIDDTTDSDLIALSDDENTAGYYYDTEGTLRDMVGNAVSENTNRSGLSNKDLSSIYAAKDMIDQDNDFLLAVSVRAADQNMYQSFDFISDPHPVTKSIPAGTELTFNVVLGNNVDPDSISININNGESEASGNLNTMGQSFAYFFPRATSSATLNVKGRGDKGIFSYSLQIPVE